MVRCLMAAHEHLRQEQFMMAKELHRMPSGDVRPEQRQSSMWRSKRRENERTGLDVHVAKHGVHNPIQIAHGLLTHGGKPVIWEGHHRIEAAYRHDPHMKVPVQHINVNEDRE